MRSPLYNLLLIFSFTLLFLSLLFLFYVWPKEAETVLPQRESSTTTASNGREVAALVGMILPAGEEGQEGRKLVNDQGQTIAYLQSGRIDLRILQSGLKVTVEGRREKILSGNIPLISVDKLSFR